MVDSYLVDASVIAKWFNRGESNEKEALTLRDAWSTGRVGLYSPALLIFEVCNAIWKNPNAQPSQAFSLAKLAIRLRPNLIEVGEIDSEEAMVFAKKSKLTFYDSIYITLAKSRKWPLITADKDQLDLGRTYTRTFHISEISDIIRT